MIDSRSSHNFIDNVFQSRNSFVSGGLDFVSEFDDLFELVVFVQELFIGFLEVPNPFFILNQLLFHILVINQKSSVFSKNLSSVCRAVTLQLGLFLAGLKDVVQSKINVVGEQLETWRVGGSMLVLRGTIAALRIKRIFCLYRGCLLTLCQR